MDQILAELSRLGDDVYFARDGRATESMPETAMSYRFKGLALGAPRVIPVESQRILPVLLVNAASAARSAQVPLNDNLMVVAADVDRGTVVVGDPFPPDPSKSPGDEPETTSTRGEPALSAPLESSESAEPPELREGDTAGTAWLDFKELLDLPWRESRFALRVISFDQVSNPVLVNLSGGNGTTEDSPRNAALVIARRVRAATRGGSGLPGFVRSAETPALSANGVALALSPTNPLQVHGALRLEVSGYSIVRPVQGADESNDTDWLHLPSAVVKATLLVTIRNRNRPARVNMDIPIWSDHELQPGEVVDAAFSLDLASTLPMQLPAGTYYIYLIAGAYLSGPHRLVLT